MTNQDQESAVRFLKACLRSEGLNTALVQLEKDLEKGLDWVIENKNPGDYSPKAKAMDDVQWISWAD